MNLEGERHIRLGEGRLAGVLHSPYEEASTCIVTCHGLYSSKDSEKYINIAHRFVQEELAVFRFDFTGCGESEGNVEDTTLTRRIEDLKMRLGLPRTRNLREHRSYGEQPRRLCLDSDC